MPEPDRFSGFERRLAELRAENQRLRSLLRITNGVEPPPEQPTLAPVDPGLVTNASPPEAKLALYMQLFAARRDVYAYRWENPRKRTKGWSPATRDQFGKGSLWDRRPLPLTAEVIARHLSNTELFIGLYPLLPDATCWWLAADFDGPQAMLDAHAYVKAAASLGVPCGLEISQSGRGAHVWTFFTDPVPAADARAMGTACIHRAMGLRGSMPLSSYDRLFPNQDTVPVGSSGVGNLIAAPLNGRRRAERRTTLFVDLATWEPWPDQWEYLSRLDRMTPRQVTAAGRRDRISVGPEVTQLEASPATTVRPRPPAQVRATLGSRLTIRDEDLPPALSAALRHAATIHNPGFYEAQRARRSTWNIPRFIQGFDVAVNGDLLLPRGLREQAATLVAQAGSELACVDERSPGSELNAPFLGELDARQTTAVDTMLAHQDGILHAPTGSGKTVMACAIIAERAVSTLVLINKTALAAQWREQIRTLLGIKAGQLGGGRVKTRGQVDIMLLQSLARLSATEIAELTAGYGQVIVDECHHIAAGSYESVVSQISAAWWLGLTATPERKDGLEQVTNWQLGPIRHVITDTLPSQATLVTPYNGPHRDLQLHETTFRCATDLDLAQPGAITQLGGLLAADTDRNHQIALDIAAALEQGRKCLVLSRRRDHLTALAALLPQADALIMRGGTGARELAAIRERIADTDPEDALLVMTTVPYGGEGFDAPIIDTVFLVGPISYPGLVVQAVGRALRRHEGKTHVIVHDYLDTGVPVLNAQYSRRRVAYRQMGFTD
ncbi:TOTE conflict system archaeo-eukaryotic primase domain-containing protein [Propionicimonas sp.]|uniref:TOTE conflict system archaeo-eukaryotic primase domain-containing protein n=1 Tax=Propionicimonas sp. TaxID=1955623 RepID=UPI0039E3B089